MPRDMGEEYLQKVPDIDYAAIAPDPCMRTIVDNCAAQ